ncbi:MAG: phage integrase N-terminal SAM-like domain-containing protein, partial [Myxococcota bacterium]
MFRELFESFQADMQLRGYRPKTMLSYGRCVRNYLAHAEANPGDFCENHATRFLLYLVRDREAGPAAHKMHAAAVKCFYEYTLGLPEVAARIPIPKVPQSLPEVLSGTEVDALLQCVEPFEQRRHRHHLRCGASDRRGLRIARRSSRSGSCGTSSRRS